MSKFAKISIGICLTLLITLLGGALALRHLVVKSFPVTNGTLRIAALQFPVDVYRDDYGVPHIRAQNEHDLMIAVGYVHAQDRLWQMDLARRAGQGRLSELLGKKTLDYDVLFRTLNFKGLAESLKVHLHADSERILEEYCDGINAFIDDHRGKYPVEFDMLNYEPEQWKVEHCLIAERLIAWELNMAWWTDLTYGEIATRVNPGKMHELIPEYPDSVPSAVPAPSAGEHLAMIHDILSIGSSYRDFFGLGPLGVGSNAWAVDSSKSLSGRPLLANDPHLAMPAPSRWYEVHLTAPGWDVSGVSLPGMPLVVIGHNDHLAWGLTNAMLDDADFFVEQIDSKDSSRYSFRNSLLPLGVHEEKLLIRPSDSLTIRVRTTHNGPIISDVHPFHLHRHPDSLWHAKSAISMRWTGLDVSDEIFGFYQMNRATSYHEFARGLKEISVPAQSVVYADVDGNIAYWLAGKVPIRVKGTPMLPQPGWSGEGEWGGFVPFEQLPHLLNPKEGFIAAANQKIAGRNFPFYLSTLWEPASRILRIRQLLQSSEKFSATDFQRFQQDVVSLYARDIVSNLLRTVDTADTSGEDIPQALNYLRNWDYRFSQSDIATTIFNAFFLKLLYNTFEDEMGEEVFHDFIFFAAIPYRVTGQLLAADSSSWFDDVRTPEIETKDFVVRKSFREALSELRSTLGSEMKLWRWGNVHTVTFKHLFGSTPPLDRVFNIGPYPVAGGGTTVSKTDYRLASPYATSVGPSMRQVVDLATPITSSIVITSGESGQAFHRHYSDQASLWLNGGYLEMTMDWNKIVHQRWDHLTLIPR